MSGLILTPDRVAPPGVGHRQQTPVAIVGESGLAPKCVRDLGDPVHRVVLILGHVFKIIAGRRQTTHGVKRANDDASQWIRDAHQIAVAITESRGVPERIGRRHHPTRAVIRKR